MFCEKLLDFREENLLSKNSFLQVRTNLIGINCIAEEIKSSKPSLKIESFLISLIPSIKMINGFLVSRDKYSKNSNSSNLSLI